MSTTPEEYFGPHAKRWTSPSGKVLSLQPVDYDRMVNIQAELDFTARELDALEAALEPAPDHEPERPRDDVIDPISQAIADRYGVPVVKHADWPNVQTFQDVDSDFAEKLSGGTLRHASLVKVQEFGHIDGADPMPDRIPVNEEMMQVLASGKPFHFTLNDDGSIAEIHPFQEEAGEPAARHLKRRKSLRVAAAALLLYVIIVIGVAAVAGVML